MSVGGQLTAHRERHRCPRRGGEPGSPSSWNDVATCATRTPRARASDRRTGGVTRSWVKAGASGARSPERPRHLRGEVRARRHPRAVARAFAAGEEQEGHHPVAVRAPGLQELRELGVVEVAPPSTAQPMSQRDVVVAEDTASASPWARCRTSAAAPDADARAAGESPLDLLAGQPDGALERVGDAGRGDQGTGSGRVDVHPQPLPRRHLADVSADGWTQSRWSAPGPGARSPYRCTSIRNPANASWPVTFCSMTAGVSASITSPVRPTRQRPWRRQAPRQDGDPRLEAGQVVVGPEQRRERVQRPVRAGAPPRRGRRPSPRARVDQQRDRAGRRTDAAPVLVADDAVRRVARRRALWARAQSRPEHGQSGRRSRTRPWLTSTPDPSRTSGQWNTF